MQAKVASPGTREFSCELNEEFAVHLLLSFRSTHARAEGIARGKKAEMVMQCTKANAKQHTEDSFQVED